MDGFRVDAVKHMGELACSRFCSNIREYAYSLGKRGFFLFGEVASPRRRGLQPLHRAEHVSAGRRQDGVLRARLGAGLPTGRRRLRRREQCAAARCVQGHKGPQTLFNRLGSAAEAGAEPRRDRALPGHVRRQPRLVLAARTGASRNGATDDQVIGAIGYLLCALGTPCIYYGTEQGFERPWRRQRDPGSHVRQGAPGVE